MNKIQEENKNCTDESCKYYDIHFEQYCSFWMDNTKCVKEFKSADLLPTEKVCPECGGWIETLKCPECGNYESLYYDTIAEGYRVCSNNGCKQEYYSNVNYCKNCNNGIIQIYYTPEQYESIKGKPYPDDGMVWYMGKDKFFFVPRIYSYIKKSRYKTIYILQTAQPAPPADYRPEE